MNSVDNSDTKNSVGRVYQRKPYQPNQS